MKYGQSLSIFYTLAGTKHLMNSNWSKRIMQSRQHDNALKLTVVWQVKRSPLFETSIWFYERERKNQRCQWICLLRTER